MAQGKVAGVAVPRSPWPLTAREVELDAVVRSLTDPSIDAIAISGPAGVGKTRLAQEALDHPQAASLPQLKVLAGPALEGVPFGALAHLLPPEALDPTTERDVVQLFDLVRQQLAGDEQRRVLFIDDVQHLDHSSAMLVLQLVNAGLVQLLMTRRDDAPLPVELTPASRSDRWASVELGPLGSSDLSALLERVLGGPVHAATLRELWQRTEGNAMYVRELLEGAVRSGALDCEQGAWVLVRPLTGTRRLRDHVAERLAALDDATRDVAELLALCQPVDVEVILAAGQGAQLSVLERSGLAVTSATEGRTLARLVHPLFAEVLAEQIPQLTRRQVLAETADRLAQHSERPEDQLRATLWRLEARADPDLDELRRALSAARSGRDFTLVARLALAAIEAGAGDEVVGALGDALYELGDFEAAAAHVHGALERARDDVAVLELALSLHRIQLWGLNQPDEALSTLAAASERVELDVLREAMRAVRANVFAYSTRPQAALDELGNLTSDIPAISDTAAVARAAALVQVGRTDDAEALARSTYETALARPAGESPIHPALHLVVRSFALCEAGRIDEAVTVASEAHHAVVVDMVTMDQMWSALNAARAELFAGRLDAAQRWAREALAITRRTHVATGERLALTVLAAALGQLGDRAGAIDVAARLAVAPPDALFLRAETAVGRAWAAAASAANLGAAVELLLEGAATARGDGVATSELLLLHEAVRLGHRGSLDRILELGAAVDGQLAAARTAHAQAHHTGDPGDLHAAARMLEACGARLVAAETDALAASQHERRGDRRAAAAARRSADRILQECPGARTPALEALTTAPLSDREREVVRMAASGMTSKEIAQRLHLSVRTVENHLQRSYTKLGITGRSELAGAISPS